MKHWIPKTILLFAALALLAVPHFQGSAQENLSKVCSSSNLETKSKELSREEYRSLLKKCLGYFEDENKQIEGKLETTKQQKQTLQNKIASLNQEIRNLNNEIRQSNLVIQDLKFQIEDTEDSIKETAVKIQQSTNKLSEILRTIYEENQKTTVEVLLAEDKLSSFFNNLVSLEVLSTRNRELLNDIKDLKDYLKEQEEALMKEKNSLEKVVAIQQSKVKENRQVKQEKEELKKMTDAEYQRYLQRKKKTEKRIENISAKLWKSLVGVREIPEYGEAVKVAKRVSDQTGVRAAFILGILTQESRIGHNVGQCVVKDFDTGAGVKVDTGEKWPRVMKPGRDIPPFRDTVQNLNRGEQPKSTLVSCWIPACYKGNDICSASVNNGNVNCELAGYKAYGWGGAMGPAQFIPSTWDKYDEKVTKIMEEPADPWNFNHATLAAGLLLGANGADARTRAAEKQAAVSYLGADYLGYKEKVMRLSDCHQSYINNGSMSAECQEMIGL